MLKYPKKRYLPVLIWAVMIMIVSSIPDLSATAVGYSFADKIAHFIEYFILGLLTVFAVRGFYDNPWRIFWISAILAALYGVFDEIHQLFVPGRTMEGWDMAADFLGSILASALYVRYLQRKTKDSAGN